MIALEKRKNFSGKRKEGEQSKIQRKKKEPRACTHLCTQIKNTLQINILQGVFYLSA